MVNGTVPFCTFGIKRRSEDRSPVDTRLEDETLRDKRPSGPRAEAREQAILDAALELLIEVGYDRFSMDALAERAKAGKATIYRHWSGKAQIVVAAVRRLKMEALSETVDTGSLRGDLLGELTQMCTSMTTEDAAIVTGVMSAMRSDPELAELVRTQIIEAKRGKFDGIIQRAVSRGELPAGSQADLVEEVMPAMLINRFVIQGEPLDEAFAVHMVDDIVLPLIHR
jgi:AcrR family transcriptional regulator